MEPLRQLGSTLTKAGTGPCQCRTHSPLARKTSREPEVVKALPRLEAGEKVEAIAFDLGYASVSAFIAMFRRLMGVTPDAFRKGAAVASSVATHPVAAL